MLLSIIIPTKNRYNCLLPVLDALVNNIPGNNYEIIVQDNTQDNSEFINSNLRVTDSRIKYFHISEPLDIIQNTDNAIMNSIGKYLLFIGDDDLVSPYIMDIISIIDKQNLDGLTYTPGNYFWTQTKFTKTSYFSAPSLLVLNNKISTNLEERDANIELDRVLRKGGCYYLNLPRFYHGIVSRTLLESLKNKFGGLTYFPGPCPDMTISVALTTVVSKFYYMNYPVSITGVSSNSGAGLGVTNSHVGRIEDQAFLPKDTIEKWNKMLPKIWTAFTIYAQSIYQVLGAAQIAKSVDYTALYAYMSVFENYTRDYLNPILDKYLKNNPHEKSRYLRLITYLSLRKIFNKPIEHLKCRLSGVYRVKNVSTVNECMDYLKKNTNIFK